MTGQYLCTILFLISRKPSVTVSSLLLHFFSSTHPIPTMWAKAQKTYTLKLMLACTGRIVLVTGFTYARDCYFKPVQLKCLTSNDILTPRSLIQHLVQLYPQQQKVSFVENNILMPHYIANGTARV